MNTELVVSNTPIALMPLVFTMYNENQKRNETPATTTGASVVNKTPSHIMLGAVITNLPENLILTQPAPDKGSKQEHENDFQCRLHSWGDAQHILDRKYVHKLWNRRGRYCSAAQ